MEWTEPRFGESESEIFGTMGIDNGLIVFVTSGPVVPVKASVKVELNS